MFPEERYLSNLGEACAENRGQYSLIVQCSIYLYSSRDAANEGSASGGSGFLVHVPSKANPGYVHLYAVTNRHVVRNNGVVLRLNQKDGGFSTISTKQDEWFEHPDGDDVAVLPIDLGETFKCWSVGSDVFITQKIIDTYRIGLGDEAFLVGRLISHDGKQKNAPVVRFGNVSPMADPTEPIQCEGREQEGFLVECRSLSGFSGSPVFVMTSQTYYGEDAERIARHRVGGAGPGDQAEAQATQSRFVSFTLTKAGPWLLGVDWGHIQLSESVYDNGEKTKNLRVDANTGIACVLPAWRIMDLLNRADLVKQRDCDDSKLARQRTAEGTAIND